MLTFALCLNFFLLCKSDLGWDCKYFFVKKRNLKKPKCKTYLTLGRQLFATPGAPDAGSSCHFRLSSLILRDTEMIATNAFFHK